MMRNSKVEHEFYKPMPETKIKEIKSINDKHFVTVQNLNNEESLTFEVSCCSVFIGSRPDLQILNNVKPLSKLESVKDFDQLSLSDENVPMRTLKRLKLFYEKCLHINLCFGFSKRSLMNTAVEDINGCEAFEAKDEVLGFCEDKSKPVDIRNNVLAVNKFSNELLNVPKGIFACGPLVGDNFVRFISGGSLLICSAILKEN